MGVMVPMQQGLIREYCRNRAGLLRMPWVIYMRVIVYTHLLIRISAPYPSFGPLPRLPGPTLRSAQANLAVQDSES